MILFTCICLLTNPITICQDTNGSKNLLKFKKFKNSKSELNNIYIITRIVWVISACLLKYIPVASQPFWSLSNQVMPTPTLISLLINPLMSQIYNLIKGKIDTIEKMNFRSMNDPVWKSLY